MSTVEKTGNHGFTLIEMAIVLTIVGLLIGGIITGRGLINSGQVKNLARDFTRVQSSIQAYRDMYRLFPGDDNLVARHLTRATLATTPGVAGNGIIEGVWNSTTQTDESSLVWQHLRLANLETGPTSTADANFFPMNNLAGRIGLQGNATNTITGLAGTVVMCSGNITGNLIRQLDALLDDDNVASGRMMATASAVTGTSAVAPVATADVIDETTYTVCMAF